MKVVKDLRLFMEKYLQMLSAMLNLSVWTSFFSFSCLHGTEADRQRCKADLS